MTKPVTQANQILGAFMALIFVLNVCQMLFVTYTNKGNILKRKNLLHLWIFICSLVRVVYLYLPSTVYVKLITSEQGVAKLMSLDLLPEVVFLFIFVLLCTTWMDTFRKSRKLRTYYTQAPFWTVLLLKITLTAIILIIAGSLILGCRFQTNCTYQQVSDTEARFISTVSFVIMGASLIFGFAVARIGKEITKSPELLKKVRGFLALVITASVALIFKAVSISLIQHTLLQQIYLLVLNSTLRKQRTNKTLSEERFAVFWFFYYICTEFIPLAVILGLLFHTAYQRRNVISGQPTTGSVDTAETPTDIVMNNKV